MEFVGEQGKRLKMDLPSQWSKGPHSAHCLLVDRSFRASDRCRLVAPSQQSKVRWLNGRASDYESGGSRFDPWVDRSFFFSTFFPLFLLQIPFFY